MSRSRSRFSIHFLEPTTVLIGLVDFGRAYGYAFFEPAKRESVCESGQFSFFFIKQKHKNTLKLNYFRVVFAMYKNHSGNV